MRFLRLLTSMLTSVLSAQLITNPQAIPHTSKPPVVFLNGHQNDCTNAPFANTFGSADQVLQQNGEVSIFFNNCSVSGGPSIEKLGTAFGAFLNNLKYVDGQSVDSVDIIAHSMGGLIVRSYLSGQQEQEGVFNPPPVTHIRKAVFIATPNFGSPVGALGFGFDTQSDELSSGSHFLMDLNTWNQNHDDLRGIDAIAIIGNGGTGLAVMAGFDDGVAALTSASLRFYLPGRTRILPLCHTETGGLLSLVGLCPTGAKGIARVNSATDDNGRIIISFLNDTADWQTIGETAEQNKFLQNGGGLLVRTRTPTDDKVNPDSLTATKVDGSSSKDLNNSNPEIRYTDLFPAGGVTLTAKSGSTTIGRTVILPPGGYEPFIVKSGPVIDGIFPAAAAIFPLVITPRMIVSLYGSNLAQGTASAATQPLPTTLSDVQVTVDGTALGLIYVSFLQINAVMPPNVSGLKKLTIRNTAGVQNLNVWIEPAFPAVFTQDQSGHGPAAALNFTNYGLITPVNPLRAGDYLILFLTGLGQTTPQGSVDIANQQPTVTVGGAPCNVTFAGAAPGYTGLDQINCRFAGGLGSQLAPVVVQSGGRTSPVTTVAVQ